MRTGTGIGLAMIVIGMLAGLTGCASTPAEEPASTSPEDKLVARVSELVRIGLKKHNTAGEIISSATPYVRFDRRTQPRYNSASDIVDGALRTACREMRGSYDAQGMTRSWVTSWGLDSKREDHPRWPTARADDHERLTLLMDTSGETGAHESAAYVGAVCLLSNERDAVLIADEDRPTQTMFDQAHADSSQFYDKPDLLRIFWFSVGSFARYADRVDAIRQDYVARATAMHEAVRPQLEAQLAQQKAKQEADAKAAADIRARLAEMQATAATNFRAAAAQPKAVGVTVCSTDNRIAYVEQVAGQRVKLTVRGHAVATYGEFGRFGPRTLTATANYAQLGDVPRPIEDANFLFQPLGGKVRVTREPDVIWADSSAWGLCDYN